MIELAIGLSIGFLILSIGINLVLIPKYIYRLSKNYYKEQQLKEKNKRFQEKEDLIHFLTFNMDWTGTKLELWILDTFEKKREKNDSNITIS